MNESLYRDLLEKVRARASEEEVSNQFVHAYLDALEQHIESKVGRNGNRICRWGMIENGQFVPGKYLERDPRFDFAIQFSFYDRQGKTLLTRAIPLTAWVRDEDEMHVICGRDSVMVLTNESGFKQGLDSIAGLLGKPLHQAIEKDQ